MEKVQLKEFGVYNVDEVANLLNISKPMAYKIIRDINDNLKDKGYITVAGKVPVMAFNERCYQVKA